MGTSQDATPRPLLSICVPTHGRPALLERALRSVVDRDQAVAERVELLVSDNSPDLDEAIVGPLLEAWRGPTRYLANRPDIGAIPNFNQCIEQASGTYVLLLHDDDFLLAGAVETIVDVLERSGDEDHALLFGVAVVDIDGHVRRRQAFREEERLDPGAALQRLLSDSSFVRIPAIVFRRTTLLEIGEFDASVGNPTDFDLLIRLFARFGVRCLTATIAGYTVHSDAATSSMFHESMIRTLTELFDRAVRTGVLPERTVRRCEADWFHQFILGGTYRPLRAGDTAAARDVFGLFRLPSMRALGRSRRWLPVRLLFRLLLLLPSRVSTPLMRMVGRLSPERLWMPL
jgi:glycosyltransferase involved in cell wall biosynthesis